MARSLLRSSEVCVCLCASVDLISNVCLSFVRIDALRRLPGYIKGTGKHAHVRRCVILAKGLITVHGRDELKRTICQIAGEKLNIK